MSKSNLLGRVGKFNVLAREDCLSSHAGMLLFKEFVERLDLSALINAELQVKERQRGYTEAVAVMGLVYNLVLGGDCLSDLEVLRGDAGTLAVLDVEQVLAPTTAGEHLRKFHIGSIWDLQRVNLLLQQGVRQEQPIKTCTMDLDSSIYEQASTRKEGSRKSYNGVCGYHPLFAFCAETDEMLCCHLRAGNAHTCRGAIWFLRETIKRVPAEAGKKLRSDSGFYSKDVVVWCEQERVEFGITADQTAPLLERIEGVAEKKWEDLERYGVAQVAELRYQPTGWEKEYRYIVKREVAEKKSGELYFRYHVFVTNNEKGVAANLLEWQLQKADLENRIKEHKSGFGMEKLPTAKFAANWAYLLISQLAYKLVAWFKRLVLPAEYHHKRAKTIRHQVLNLAGKIIHTGRQWFLVISDKYKYQHVWKKAIKNLAALDFSQA